MKKKYKDQTIHTCIRSQLLKISQYTPEFQTFYNDIQSDYRKFLPVFHELIAIGFVREQKDKTIIYTTPEESEQNRQRKFGDVGVQFANIMFPEKEDKSSAGSGYNVFFDEYNPNDKAYFVDRVSKFLLELNDLSLKEIDAKLKNDKQLSLIPASEWKEIGRRIKNQDDAKYVWSTIAHRLTNPDRLIGEQLRHKLGIKCRRPTDKVYCAILFKMLHAQTSSIYEKYKHHLSESKELNDRLQNRMSDSQNKLFPIMLEFATELKNRGSGLSKQIIELSIFGSALQNSKVPLAMDILKQPQYKPMLEAERTLVNYAYYTWKLQNKIQRRKLYPLYPNTERDYKVPIGLSSLGQFTIDATGEQFTLGRKNCYGSIQCQPSLYFHNLKVEPVRVKGSTAAAYNISFAHKLKSKKNNQVGRTIQGIVKEIGVQKKKGTWFLTLSYTITHNFENFGLLWFHRKAAPKLSDFNLPDSFVAAGIDLNISNPVCIAKAKINRYQKTGTLFALDYGRGQLLPDYPIIAAEDGKRCSKIRDIAQNAVDVKDAIREINECQKLNQPILPETWEFLRKKGQSENPRFLIQTWVAALRKKLCAIHYDMRKEGYSNIAEMIQMLKATDTLDSMCKSYHRTFLGEIPYQPDTNKSTKRANFRREIQRRIARLIANQCHDCNIVFVENLDANYDRDKNTNSLQRLFSGPTLLKYIELALEKDGIAMVSVEKDGTSKTDPITGSVGYRNKMYDKTKLYVKRDGKLGWIHSDKAAAINVLIRGLNHSVCPYGFDTQQLNDQKKLLTGKNGDDGKKRLPRFLNLMFGTTKVIFEKQSDQIVPQIITDRKMPPLKEMTLYAHENGTFVDKSVHEKQEETIKDNVLKNPKCPEFPLTLPDTEKYLNFAIPAHPLKAETTVPVIETTNKKKKASA